MQTILKFENDSKIEIYKDPYTSYKHLNKGNILMRTISTDLYTYIYLVSYQFSLSSQKDLESGKMY